MIRRIRLPSKDALPPVDVNGHKVPNRLAKVFAGRRFMAIWCEKIDELIGAIGGEADKDYLADAPVAEAKRALCLIRTKIMTALPAEVCQCVDLDCPLCDGKRWVSLKRLLEAQKSLLEDRSGEGSSPDPGPVTSPP
jgi:hypothetical protein